MKIMKETLAFWWLTETRVLTLVLVRKLNYPFFIILIFKNVTIGVHFR